MHGREEGQRIKKRALWVLYGRLFPRAKFVWSAPCKTQNCMGGNYWREKKKKATNGYEWLLGGITPPEVVWFHGVGIVAVCLCGLVGLGVGFMDNCVIILNGSVWGEGWKGRGKEEKMVVEWEGKDYLKETRVVMLKMKWLELKND